jgi:hypothetical protein
MDAAIVGKGSVVRRAVVGAGCDAGRAEILGDEAMGWVIFGAAAGFGVGVPH